MQDLNWRLSANCRGMDTESFYPTDRMGYREAAEHARRICNGGAPTAPCPVREACLKYALDQKDRHGIWGGLSHRERNALLRKAARLGVPALSLIR